VFANIDRIRSLFPDAVVLFAYDPSTDDSLVRLQQYQQKHPGSVFVHVYTGSRSTVRTANIARARNQCLQMIRQQFPEVPYFIMMDCDDVCTSPIRIPVLEAHLYRTDWDALTFNRRNYYDLWALSLHPYFGSYMHYVHGYSKWKRNLVAKLRALQPHQLLPCLSAFNGFAVYRTPLFIDGQYDGEMRLNAIPQALLNTTFRYAGRRLMRGLEKGDCEHRLFHLQAIQKHGARIRISPHTLFPG
jgi:glycosyltransferase involved in cell wall biosynthesis